MHHAIEHLSPVEDSISPPLSCLRYGSAMDVVIAGWL